MKTTLLTNAHIIQKWFRNSYPEIEIKSEVDDETRNNETIIIVTMNRVHGDYFEILSMWNRYMRVRHGGHKLFVLGWQEYRSSNYLRITDMPISLTQKVMDGLPIKKNVNYPALVDRNILLPIGNFLLSHGNNTFHRLLIKIRKPLREVEQKLKNRHIHQIREDEAVKMLHHDIKSLQELWKNAQPFFAFMPNYPEIKQYVALEKKLFSLLYEGKQYSPYLYIQIGEYLNHVLTEITDFYKLDAT